MATSPPGGQQEASVMLLPSRCVFAFTPLSWWRKYRHELVTHVVRNFVLPLIYQWVNNFCTAVVHGLGNQGSSAIWRDHIQSTFCDAYPLNKVEKICWCHFVEMCRACLIPLQPLFGWWRISGRWKL